MEVVITKDCIAVQKGNVGFLLDLGHWEVRFQRDELIFFILMDNDVFVSGVNRIKEEFKGLFDFEQVEEFEYGYKIKFRGEEIGQLCPYGDGSGIFYLSLTRIWEIVKSREEYKVWFVL